MRWNAYCYREKVEEKIKAKMKNKVKAGNFGFGVYLNLTNVIL